MSLWTFRLRAASKAQADGAKKTRIRDRAARAIPAPEANAELQSNIDVCSINYIFDILRLYFIVFHFLVHKSLNRSDEVNSSKNAWLNGD